MARYSAVRIAESLRRIDEAPTADARGESLEDLSRYLFEKVPGVSFAEKNVLDGPRAHELDLAFWNPQNRSLLGFLDVVLIVECKSGNARVTSQQVGWFVRKLQDRGCSYGILIALNGITGAHDGASNAHSEVLTALMRDRVKILIVSREELISLRTTDNLAELLKSKLLRLTLYRTVN